MFRKAPALSQFLPGLKDGLGSGKARIQGWVLTEVWDMPLLKSIGGFPIDWLGEKEGEPGLGI